MPAYSKALEAEGEEKADVLAADAMATLAAATLVLTILADLAMPWLMHLISPGYTGAKYKLADLLTQIFMTYLPAMDIAAHLSGVLNARGRFIVSAVHPALLNLMMLIFVLPQRDPVAAAKWASAGVLVAGASPGGASDVGRAQVRREGRLETAESDAPGKAAHQARPARGDRRQRDPDQRLYLGHFGELR